MIRLRPSTISLAVTEIREYDDRVRFKNHLRRCRAVGSRKLDPRPIDKPLQVVDSDSGDEAVWSDYFADNQEEPSMSFTMNTPSGSNTGRGVRCGPIGEYWSRILSTP